MNVSDRPTFLIISERFMTVSGLKKVGNDHGTFMQTVRNGCNSERIGTLKNVQTGTNSGKSSRFKNEQSTVLKDLTLRFLDYMISTIA
jgi:hypothetical protein